MKSNVFKYLFIIFVIIIVIVAFLIIRHDEQESQNSTQESDTQVQQVKDIRLGIAQFDTLNPLLTHNKNIQDIAKLIFEPLVDISADYKATPALATEWAKQDATTYIIKLRENVKWSNGERFTSADVQFTYDRLKENSSIYSTNLSHVTTLEIVDDYTVKMYLDQEVPFFEYNLTFPILSKTFYDTQDYNNTSIVPVGTGMYKVSDVQETYITLTKNTNWWNRDTELSLEKIVVNLYTSVGELYNSFKIGNVDMVATSNNNLSDYIGTIGYTPKEIKGREHDFIALNTQNTLLSREEVRKAISYSIDKNNIVSSVYNNKYYTSSFPLDFGSWTYQEQDASSGYNVEQAKQLLTDAGWTYRNKRWQKTENYRTQRLELNMIVKASNQNQVAVAENISTQLANQGIIINVQQYSDKQYNIALQNKSYDMILCSVNLSPNPDMSLFFGENNLANYSTDEITNIMNEVKNTTDEEIIKNDYKRLAEIYKNNIPYISLYNNKYTIAYSSELVGNMSPNWFNPFYGIETWYR